MSEVQYVPPPPPPPAPPAASTEPQFDFGKPFTFVFEDPRWTTKILLGGLFYLAGFLLVGWFFILGYLARVARNVIQGHERPLPEWDDLGAFFSEGLRLFGVVLVWVLPFIVMVAAFIVPAAVLSEVDNDALRNLGSGVGGCVSCLMVPMALLLMLFMPASLLFAAVEERFGAAFDFGRIWPFIKANIGNYLLAIVVWMIARFVGGVGILLLCIGVVFTGFWSFLIATHGFAQVYRLAVKKA